MSLKDPIADKAHTLKATESVLEYLCRDVGRLGFEGLLYTLNGARCYCTDLLTGLDGGRDGEAAPGDDEQSRATRNKDQ